jgi:hypothetical protein
MEEEKCYLAHETYYSEKQYILLTRSSSYIYKIIYFNALERYNCIPTTYSEVRIQTSSSPFL